MAIVAAMPQVKKQHNQMHLCTWFKCWGQQCVTSWNNRLVKDLRRVDTNSLHFCLHSSQSDLELQRVCTEMPVSVGDRHIQRKTTSLLSWSQSCPHGWQPSCIINPVNTSTHIILFMHPDPILCPPLFCLLLAKPFSTADSVATASKSHRISKLTKTETPEGNFFHLPILGDPLCI